jgi:hypothetical protein
MASIHPHQAATGQMKPHKVLTAGFNSPVPECTLQVASHLTQTRRQQFATEQTVKQSTPLGQRSWFGRLLEIF